jgi:hypothetical protein
MHKPIDMFLVIHDDKFIKSPATPATYTEHLGFANYWGTRELAEKHAVAGDIIVCVQDIYDAIKTQTKFVPKET